MNGRRRHDRKQRTPEFETPGLGNGQANQRSILFHIKGNTDSTFYTREDSEHGAGFERDGCQMQTPTGACDGKRSHIIVQR